jgi:hypothetical protein
VVPVEVTPIVLVSLRAATEDQVPPEAPGEGFPTPVAAPLLVTEPLVTGMLAPPDLELTLMLLEPVEEMGGMFAAAKVFVSEPKMELRVVLAAPMMLVSLPGEAAPPIVLLPTGTSS